MELDRQATNPNSKPYFVAVKYGGLASLYRKFMFAISHRLMSFLSAPRVWNSLPVSIRES